MKYKYEVYINKKLVASLEVTAYLPPEEMILFKAAFAARWDRFISQVEIKHIP